jgi:FAD/FMN-containing dehydrogenase
MKNIKKELINLGFKGDINLDVETRDEFSHDASMFELMPEVVVSPKDSQDVSHLISWVSSQKNSGGNGISITARSAGTDMGGGAITESIILNMKKYFTKIGDVTATSAHVQPGVFYRDFEKETLKHNALMPSYPASRDLCTVGGMVANNSGGEKSLQHGKTEKFVKELSVVFADGKEYTVKPLNKEQLGKKLKQKDFEGEIYREIFLLVDENYDIIKNAKPNVSKDSTGYHLWNVWDKEKGIFDLTQLIVGSQGTLGIVTDIKFKLVAAPKETGILTIFLRDIDQLGDIINTVLKRKPATFEGFDNYTLMLSIKLFFFFYKKLGWLGMIKLGLQLLPTALKLTKGIPKMVLLVEFNGDSDQEVTDKVYQMREDLRPFDSYESYEINDSEEKAQKFWIMRRESFNLLRNKVHDKHTAPFIDDLVVPPQHLPEFLPKLRKIINKYKLLATIAGHMGDGNFHVIPLMKFEEASERKKLEPAMREVNKLVIDYGGSLSGEHNDGMVRGPWLHTMYSPKIMKIFRQVKHIFDADNIFNPKKKTDAKWEYSIAHLREHF